jgi:peptidoglycan hydrolase-like protein with peptidoglycan-binding domain
VALRAGRFSRNPRLAQAAEGKPSLKQGEKGEAVAVVQQALIDLGFAMPLSTGNGRSLPDGKFGPETARTVSRFQKEQRLAADGIVGRSTLARLDDLIIARAEASDAGSKLFARSEFTLRTAKPRT